MIRISICDDEEIVIDNLLQNIKAFFDQRNEKTEIFTYTESRKFLEEFLEKKLDLIFLDIDMPEITGFQIAATIRSFNQNVSIIFVTGYDDMVYSALKYKIFRFLRKSRLKEELETALQDWIGEYKSYRQQKVFETKEGMMAVKIKDIKYIDVHGHEIIVFMSDNSHFTLKSRIESLSSLENELGGYGFLRIHKGCLLNYKYIKTLKKTDALLDNDESLPISRDRYKRVLNDYHMFVRGESECGRL